MILKLLLKISLCILIGNALSCGPVSVSKPHSIDLSGSWKIIISDNRKFADCDYDYLKKQDIGIPGEWFDVINKNENLAATVWLRKRVRIDNEFSKSDIILDLGEIGVADETYVNGVFIGGRGSIPLPGSLDYGFAWKNPRQYVIPKPVIKYGGENCIAVRVFSHVFSGITGKPRIVERLNGHPDELIRGYIPFTINLFALTFNLIFFFIYLVLYAATRGRRVYLYFTLIVLSGIIFNLSVMNSPLLINGLLRFKLLLFAYASISFYVSMSMQEIFDIRFKFSSPALLFMIGSITVAIFAASSTRALIGYCGPAAIASVLIFQAYSAFIFFKAVTQIPQKYWLLLFLAPVLFSALRNSYYLFTMQFNVVHYSIFLHVPVVIFVVTLFFFYDYEHEKRHGEGIYQTLLRKSRKLQRDLKKAKKIDAKPEPQELIHGLINYLDQNFTETYNRKELSKKFGLNSNYMVQLFKKTTGETISNYINNKRIENAKTLLRESDYKIIDIAFHIGFENYTHFHRLFKRITGMTPREYRIYSNE